MVAQALPALLRALRPNAVALVDAFALEVCTACMYAGVRERM